jgi:segregation and condensation protein B
MTDDELDFGLEQFGEIDDDQGLSLEELSQAYASMIDSGGDPYTTTGRETESTDEGVSEPWEMQLSDADEACEISPESILEAMLFVGHPENHPLTSRMVASLMRGVRPAEIDEMVRELNLSYQEQRCPYEIRSVAGGYRLELRAEFSTLKDRFYGRIRAARLSQHVVDALAIVAYKQPISKAEVEAIRGKPSGGVLSQLVRRELIKLVREESRPEPAAVSNDAVSNDAVSNDAVSNDAVPAKDNGTRKKSATKMVPMYYTTERFLQVFGLVALDDLPRSDDIDRLW